MRLATRQHGHIHRQQLVQAGLGRGAIAHRLRTGWLQEVHPSVYRLAAGPRSRAGRCMAAALLFAGYAVVSQRDAASLWQLLDTTQEPPENGPVHVVLAGRSFRPRPEIVVRRVAHLPRSDVRWRQGVPVTSPARTLLDLAGTMSGLDLEAALATAFRRNLARRAQLYEVMTRNPRARGIALLRSLLAQAEPLHDTRSSYERRLLELLRAAGLPTPLTNVPVAGHMVDGLCPT
ncbi:MAG TPA: type IV toxin-antitoxin system AbiEi family antitoxin domain-containing protein [Solirubrobacteraceae bacterium]|nr:type IV toxin-antitoxin system AbiEi family antitoxin domain-containing protein [Solirubrobacteraceae bacterium]